MGMQLAGSECSVKLSSALSSSSRPQHHRRRHHHCHPVATDTTTNIASVFIAISIIIIAIHVVMSITITSITIFITTASPYHLITDLTGGLAPRGREFSQDQSQFYSTHHLPAGPSRAAEVGWSQKQTLAQGNTFC